MDTLFNGAHIRERRITRGLTQHALAAQAGVDASVVSRLERGLQDDVHLSVFVALAHVLESPLDDFLAPQHQMARQIYPELVPELAIVVNELGTLTRSEQQQIAAMLQSYLATRRTDAI